MNRAIPYAIFCDSAIVSRSGSRCRDLSGLFTVFVGMPTERMRCPAAGADRNASKLQRIDFWQRQIAKQGKEKSQETH